MPLDPSTLCARTAAGDAELAAPRHGLAIAQRRLLSVLDQPVALDELGRRPGLLAERLERDLGRLTEHGLVELHRPSGSPAAVRPALQPIPTTPIAPSRPEPPPWTAAQPVLSASAPPTTGGMRVILGRKVRWGRALVLGFLTVAAVGFVAWWLAPATPEPARPVAAPAPTTSAPAARKAEAPAQPTALPEPPKVVGTPESFVTAPAPASPAVASVALPAPAPRPAPAAPPSAGPAKPEPSPAAIATPATDAVRSPPAVAGGASTPAPPPTESVPAAPSAPPPVQLAAATPSTLETRSAPKRLEPVTREPPEFPREAMSGGITKGTVRARLAIDASGKVTAVEILDAQPRRVFDRAVTRALSRWTYEPGEPSRSAEVEVAFQRE